MIAIDQRQQRVLLHAVHFIQQQVHRPAKPLHPLKRKSVARAEIGRRINNQREHIHAFERMLQLVHHHAAKNIPRLMDSRRINQHDLRVLAIHDPLNAIARGLRLRRDDRNLLANKRVHERRFARVWSAYNGNES